MAQNSNPENLARVSQVRMGIKSFLEAVDILPGDSRVSVQLGVLLAPMRSASIEEAKTLLRKFDQALALLKDDQVVMPTMHIIPVNDLEEKLSAQVVSIYNARQGAINGSKTETVEAETVQTGIDSAQTAEGTK